MKPSICDMYNKMYQALGVGYGYVCTVLYNFIPGSWTKPLEEGIGLQKDDILLLGICAVDTAMNLQLTLPPPLADL